MRISDWSSDVCSSDLGLVMIEALACGTPVAAYPVIGPRDILTDDVGATDRDLAHATALALGKDRRFCAAYGRTFSWQRSADQFEHALVSVRSGDGAGQRSEEHTSELQSLMRISSDVFCLKTKTTTNNICRITA